MMPDGSGKKSNDRIVVAAVSGGPDSVYLLRKLASRRKEVRVIAGHVNYGTRGRDSLKDQVLVEKIGKKLGIRTDILSVNTDKIPGGSRCGQGRFPAGFEKTARDSRYHFLRGLSERTGAEAIALAHTADDQVETILMRMFEGAGIAGLKGIPRQTGDGIVRPILDVWKEDILNDLNQQKIPYRIDRSNLDTRFERNWVRHVLIPLLVKRYGKAVKKRIFTLGERFRELDDYIDAEARRWVKRNLTDFSFRRERYSALQVILRVKILQRICFDRLGIAPNERLLKAMDRNLRVGGPSARVKVGKGWGLVNRYEHATFLHEGTAGSRIPAKAMQGLIFELEGPGKYELPVDPEGGATKFIWKAKEKISPAQAKRLAAKGNAEVFDAATLLLPLTVRPLRAGDRIRPFGRDAGGSGGAAGRTGRDADKRVKEILIDRKIPRDARRGRPVVCDAKGAILWIPGVLRSAHAPVTPATREAVLLRVRTAK